MLEANERLLMNFTPQVKGTVEPSVVIKGPVWLEETACIRSGSYIDGPAYIGEKSVVGPNARIRPCTSIGDEVNLGTSCEVKNSIIMSGSKVPHLSYIGDSVIGEKCNLAAGTITANIRLDEEPVTVNVKGKCVSSGMNKLGTIMGDQVQTGINSSIMPGVKIGASSYIGPGAVVYNDVPENCRVFARQSLVTKPGRTRSRE
jgi:bifunctional UDP-N-acetylglucosamine pyrophosphorylase/glucosamine-1-phosphate N-acetyltransferase